MVCGSARAQNYAINQNPILKKPQFVFDPLAGFSGHGERDLATGLAGGFLRNDVHSGFSRSALNCPCLAGCLAGCLEGARR